MTAPAKRKGDKAEREAAALLTQLELDVRRNYGAGRYSDPADLVVERLFAVQVRNYTDFGRACIESAADAKLQAVNGGVPYGVGMSRRRGGNWVFTLTPETFARLATALAAAAHGSVATGTPIS